MSDTGAGAPGTLTKKDFKGSVRGARGDAGPAAARLEMWISGTPLARAAAATARVPSTLAEK